MKLFFEGRPLKSDDSDKQKKGAHIYVTIKMKCVDTLHHV